MPKTYRCMNPERHVFVEGTAEYVDLSEYPPNKKLGVLFRCPRDGSMLLEENDSPHVRVSMQSPIAGLRPQTQYALLLLVADVSGSMRDPVATEAGTRTKLEEVGTAIADVLRGLALPKATTANSLLVGMLTFAVRALWLDLTKDSPDFVETPVLLNASQFAQKLGGVHFAIGTDRTNEITVLRTKLAEVFERASQCCGPNGTSYQDPISRVGRVLQDVRDNTKRKALRSDWDVIYKDNGGREYIRTFFYSDGAPDEDEKVVAEQSRRTFLTDWLITSSFSPDGDRERAESLLGEMASTCPIHSGEKCSFGSAETRRFRDIIKMASGGAGFCPQCLRER